MTEDLHFRGSETRRIVKPEAPKLFDDVTRSEQAHWEGMPEFVQGKQKPYREIIVRFTNEKDVLSFAALLKQSVTAQTKALWYPALENDAWGEVYVDES